LLYMNFFSILSLEELIPSRAQCPIASYRENWN
jgi:hypothetical protein